MKHTEKEIMKMKDYNVELYFDILENPDAYSKEFIKSNGLPYMIIQKSKGDYVDPIIDLYNEIISK